MLNLLFFLFPIATFLVLGLSIRIKFQVSIFTSVSCAPLLMLATSFIAQMLNGSFNNLVQPQLLWPALGLIQFFGCCLFLISQKRSLITEVMQKDFIVVLLLAAFSASIWFFASDFFHAPPKDNDAIVHLFTIRWLSTDSHTLSCLLPRDAISNMGLRFVPCASHILSLSAVPSLQMDHIFHINLVYGITAFLIPFGAASLSTLNPQSRIDPRILSIVSISFLTFPYALNGLMPFSLGLALIIPSVMLVKEVDNYVKKILLSLLLSVILFAVHPIAVVFFLISSLAVSRERFGAHPRRLAVFTVLLIALSFFGYTQISLVQSLFNGISAGNASSVSTSSKFINRVFLGNEWTRAQPIIMGFFVWGLLISLRFKKAIPNGLVGLTLVLYFLWLLIPYDYPLLAGMTFIFYGDWYRVLAVLTVFLWLPVSIAVSKLISIAKQHRKFSLNFFSIAMALLIVMSVGTGYRIVKQAWDRNGSIASDVLKSMSKLKTASTQIALNNPNDGSAWAYSIAGVEVVAATDRGVDQLYGTVLESLNNLRVRKYVCVIQQELGFTSVFLVKDSLQIEKELSPVLGSELWSDGQVALVALDEEFLEGCKRLPECIRFSTAPEWFTAIATERFRSDRNWDCSSSRE